MAKPLVFSFSGAEIPLAMSKVERSDLYGYVETEALDDKGRKCTMAVLADDGQTLIGSGGTAFASLSTEGHWLEKSKLKPVDAEGRQITPVPSSFSAPVELEQTCTIAEYLSYNVRSVYQLSSEADITALEAELKKGTIFTFPYSYRGGLEPDTGFLLMAADGTIFLAVGSATRMEYVGFEQTAGLAEDDQTAEEESEEIDFNML